MNQTDQSFSGSLSETFRSELKTLNQNLRVALPGIIQAFDPETVTAVVQPAVRYVNSSDEGYQTTHFYPQLVDVPVIFPRGGGCTLALPIKEGEGCLGIFADRCIAFWWQSGGVQESADERMHDMSDAFAIVGPRSQMQKIGAINTSAVEIRSDDGATRLSLSPESGTINGTAPGGFNLNGLKIHPDGRLELVDGSIVDQHSHGGVESGGASTAPLGG